MMVFYTIQQEVDPNRIGAYLEEGSVHFSLVVVDGWGTYIFTYQHNVVNLTIIIIIYQCV